MGLQKLGHCVLLGLQVSKAAALTSVTENLSTLFYNLEEKNFFWGSGLYNNVVKVSLRREKITFCVIFIT